MVAQHITQNYTHCAAAEIEFATATHIRSGWRGILLEHGLGFDRARGSERVGVVAFFRDVALKANWYMDSRR